MINLDKLGIETTLTQRSGWRRLTVAVLSVACGPLAWAAGPEGKVGTRTSADTQAQQRADTENGNRIVVSNNSVNGVRCDDGGSVSINSVNVNRESLKGRTVIVQGRNVTDVRSEDCAKQGTGAQQGTSTHINSVNIR